MAAPRRRPRRPVCCLASAGAFLSRLRIGFRITGRQLQGTVDIAYRTDRKQVMMTILWASRLDGFSRRILAQAMRAAVRRRPAVRVHALAAAARDLLHDTLRTLAACHRGRPLRRSFISEAGPRREQLLAAIGDLRNHDLLGPRVTFLEGAEAGASLQEALSALQRMSDSFSCFLQEVLQPLSPHIGPHAVRAIILETRAEIDELAACQTVGDLYVESLTVTIMSPRSVCVELEACLGSTEQE